MSLSSTNSGSSRSITTSTPFLVFVMSMFDEGVVAVIPIETSINPMLTNSYNVENMRTAKILEWMPNHIRVEVYNDRIGMKQSLIVPNRIALDVASFDFQHVRLDQNGRYLETMAGPLTNCLTVEANKDQTGRAFIQDVVMSMFDEGCVS